MMFQTYLRRKDGKWFRFDPAPEGFDTTKKTIRTYTMLLRNKNHGELQKYTHICAMPISWSFA